VANDGLGDRCKGFEQAEAGRRAMRGLPLLARLDGRAFHTFTRDMQRPYEPAMSRCMIETTRHLVQESIALVGYTQSDEITLAWYETSESASDYSFDGRFQKLASVLAGMASARFCQLVAAEMPGRASAVPHFDCRVWQVPTLADAADVFVWREDDAAKNSVSMAASALYTDRDLHGKDSSVKQGMLLEKGVNWNDYPGFFKRGSYLQRRSTQRALTDEERMRIPEAHRPPAGQEFSRTQVVELDLPRLRNIANLTAVLFQAATPEARA
jgi:tRNA(His) 5'-end guanylyltransferase